uniref:Uncharacterized protein n=1 Tax=Elmago virus TaxID=3077879 RepID=A0AA96H9Y0_9VIRU|nr:MAG: hypothetical protein [Elmago virus]
MTDIKTTFPNPPVGQINPEVPLGVSATLVQDPIPQDNPPFKELNINELQWIYIDSFDISASNAVGKHLYSWDSYQPLGSQWKAKIDTEGMIVQVPQSLKKAYFASFFSVEWMLKFEPIKVTDSRVEVVALSQFDGGVNNNNLVYGDAKTSSYNMENQQFTFDDPHKVFIMKPALYQMTTKVSNNDYISVSNTGDVTKIVPMFVPTTQVSLKQKSKFVHNNLQPSSFTVNVWVAPIIRSISQFHSRLLNLNVPHESLPLLAFSPLPYWLNRDQVPISDYIKSRYPKVKLSFTFQQILAEARKAYNQGYTEEEVIKHLKKYIITK